MPTNRSIEPNGARWIITGWCVALSLPTYSRERLHTQARIDPIL
jgi:hypothetical protein